MSMICGLLGLSPAQIVALRATPALAGDVAFSTAMSRMLSRMSQMPPEARQAAEAQSRAAMEQALGPERTAQLAAARERLGPFEEALSLEKSWHMLHYLFTGHVYDAPAPGNALVAGEDIGDDMGYGPARLHEPKATQEFASFLQTQDVSRLQERVNYREMASLQIYSMPMGRGTDAQFEAELRQEVGLYFPQLRDYVVKMAEKQYGLLIWMS